MTNFTFQTTGDLCCFLCNPPKFSLTPHPAVNSDVAWVTKRQMLLIFLVSCENPTNEVLKTAWMI